MTLDSVQKTLGYRFKNLGLMIQALTHSSFFNEQSGRADSQGFFQQMGFRPEGDNERLEFLGDAVIGLVVGEMLMDHFPEACEGRLSRWRSSLVSRKTMAELARDLGLGEHLLLGRGEARSGGASKRSILGAALEALVGALYIDGGLVPARAFLKNLYEGEISKIRSGDDDPRLADKKTILQERTQSLYKSTPNYRLIGTWGREHEKHFQIEIVVQGDVLAMGEGRSKKEAEQNAAGKALETLEASP